MIPTTLRILDCAMVVSVQLSGAVGGSVLRQQIVSLTPGT
ncbi:hypothetical protein JOF48_003029 [Arthrobacter stackebrandtii]|uniref:Uncharacterized protein n=1 Tax=Arthrobacter stackebrandtii TaxID=272161 RepID=A0ABS4Z0K3_9MICC|nr:hypothetical protein [Arthrobacter stackebrandtii]